MDVIVGLTVIAALVGITVFALGGGVATRGETGGRPRQWSLRRAGSGRSVHGYLVIETLALISVVQLGLELGALGGPRWLPVLVLALLACQAGLVLAPRRTMTTLAALGVLGTFVTMARGSGPAVAASVLFVVAMISWLGGLLRGR